MEDGQRYDKNKAFNLGSASNITQHRFDGQPFTISGLDSMYRSNVRIVPQGSVLITADVSAIMVKFSYKCPRMDRHEEP